MAPLPVQMERTLILCKPDCIDKNLIGAVLARFEAAGLRISSAKTLRLTPELLAEHYSHIKDRPFFPEIVEFMRSRPVLAVILNGPNAQHFWITDRLRSMEVIFERAAVELLVDGIKAGGYIAEIGRILGVR